MVRSGGSLIFFRRFRVTLGDGLLGQDGVANRGLGVGDDDVTDDFACRRLSACEVFGQQGVSAFDHSCQDCLVSQCCLSVSANGTEVSGSPVSGGEGAAVRLAAVKVGPGLIPIADRPFGGIEVSIGCFGGGGVQFIHSF